MSSDLKRENEMDDEGKIAKIRGMPWSTTVEEIIDFFKESVVLNGTNGVHLVMTREGRPSGEAFIEFETADDLEKALKKDRDYMGTRYIEVFACKRTEMEWMLRKSGTNSDQFSDEGFVRLRGLPFECSRDDISQFFSGLEILANGITLPVDHKGRCTGEAFVQFRSKANAEKALDKHKEKIGHRYIEVFRSSMNEVYPEGRMRMGGNSMGGSGGGSGMFPPRPTPYDARNRFGGPNRFSSNGISRNFRDEDNGDDWGDMWGGGNGGGGGRMPNMGTNWNVPRFGGGFGGGKNFSSNGNGPPGPYIVHMRGLPFRSTKQDIADFFAPVIPLSIDLTSNEQGRPSGEANVEFRSFDDATDAMRKHKSLMSHRYIELFMNVSGGRKTGSSSTGGGGGYRTKRF